MEYSELFNTYFINNKIPFNNILKKVQLPNDKTSQLYQKYIVPYTMPWIYVSHKLYGDIKYYWLVQLANDGKKLNPFYAEISTELDVIRPEYLNLVINAIKESK